MTSAIDNMSVAEVRKFLGECRKKHTIQTPDHPMFITDVLSNGMQLQEFALKFQQGHHQKRHNKSRKHGQGRTGHGGTSSSDDDDYYDEYNTSESDEDTNSSSTSPSSNPQQQQHPQTKLLLDTPPSKQPTHKYIPLSKNGNNNSSSISNTLTAAIVKKRGRPKKDKTLLPHPHSHSHSHLLQNSDHTSSSRTEHHSRSLMEFVKKPTKRTKI